MVKPSLTKTCSSCGQQKPLSAFLELSGAHGSRYGNICASCRKTHAEKAKKPQESEEGSRSDTSLTIGNKEKIIAHVEQERKRKQLNVEHHEEREKQEKQQTEQFKTTTIETEEKYRKRSFWEKRHVPSVAQKTNVQRSTQPPSQSERLNQQSHNLEVAERKEQATQDEQKEKEIRMDTPVDIMRVSGKIAVTQGEAIKAFAAWLGKDSPLARTLVKNAGQKTNPQKGETVEKKDPLVNKTWSKPPGRGR